MDTPLAVMLLDVVLGYGSHPDPAGMVVPALQHAQDNAQKRGGRLAFVASVLGTDADHQGYAEQCRKLEKQGVMVMPSNAQAARLALALLEEVHG